MNTKKIKILISIVVSICILFTTAVSSFASSNEETLKQESAAKAFQKNNQIYQNAIEVLTPYVSRQDDGTFELNAPNKVIKSLGECVLTRILSGMALINSEIKNGKLKSKDSLVVYDPLNNDFSIQANQNMIVYQWYGFDLYLDNQNTQTLLALIAGGAGATAIAAAICGMIPFGQLASGVLWIVDGIITIGGAVIAYNAAPGRGIFIRFVQQVPVYICPQSYSVYL